MEYILLKTAVVYVVVCYMVVKHGRCRNRMSWHFSLFRWERLDGCVTLKKKTGSRVVSWKRD